MLMVLASSARNTKCMAILSIVSEWLRVVGRTKHADDDGDGDDDDDDDGDHDDYNENDDDDGDDDDDDDNDWPKKNYLTGIGGEHDF